MVSHGQVLKSEKLKLNVYLELDRNVKLMLQKMNKSTTTKKQQKKGFFHLQIYVTLHKSYNTIDLFTYKITNMKRKFGY